MKNIRLAAAVVTVLTGILASNLYAKPERMSLKSGEARSEAAEAKARLAKIKPERIEDPETRQVIQEILTILKAKG